MITPALLGHRGLYAITPNESDTEHLLARVQPVLAAGAALLQYRNKSAPIDLRRTQIAALLPLCRRYQVPLIVNDDVALASELGADGVHLGADDGDPSVARRRLGEQAIVGASCYNDLGRAHAAAAAGASYLAFGACHPSTTKPGRPRASPALFEAAGEFGLPRVAIGGLRPENAGVFVAAGVEFIAAVGGLFGHADPGVEACRYIDLFKDRKP